MNTTATGEDACPTNMRRSQISLKRNWLASGESPALRAAIRLVAIGLFALVVAFPYVHAQAPGHDSHRCQLCQAIMHGVVLVVALAALVATRLVAIPLALPAVVSPKREIPTAARPRAPPSW